jgi:mono/diheme cytochrome c family protein
MGRNIRSGMAAGIASLVLTAAPGHGQDRAQIEAGQALYETHCVSCHGERLQNPGSSFDLRALHPNERPRFETAVQDGKGTQMPPWRGVFSTDELDQLWAYVRENAYD